MSHSILRLIRNAEANRSALAAQNVAHDAALQADLADAIAIQPAPATMLNILDRNIAAIDRALESARQHAAGLDAELARATEELRQTRVSIEAFELAHERMVR